MIVTNYLKLDLKFKNKNKIKILIKNLEIKSQILDIIRYGLHKSHHSLS